METESNFKFDANGIEVTIVKKENKYPHNDGLGHISNLYMVKEIKFIKSCEIELINELIKKDWIFICTNSNQEILLGRI